MTDKRPESEPAVRESTAWIDDEMRADSSVWDAIERFGTSGEYPRFRSLALLVDPIQFDVEPNHLTKNEYFEFIRYEIAGDDPDDQEKPIRESVNRCNRAWQEMMIHARVGFNPDRDRDFSRDILSGLVKPLRREAVLFGLALVFQLEHQSERDTSPMFDNICAEFKLSPTEQRGIARLAAKTRPDETLCSILLEPGGRLAERLTGPDGRPDLDYFGISDALARCKAKVLTRLVKHGSGDPAELESRLRELYPKLMDPGSDSAELREQLAEAWWSKLMYTCAGLMNRSDDSVELATPLRERVDRDAVLARVRSDIAGVIADPPPSPPRGPGDEAFYGPWQPDVKAAKALERFDELFPEVAA